MQFTSIVFLLLSSFLGFVTANGNMTWTSNQSTITTQFETTSTQVVTAYTTYCPEATTFTEGNKTYTATGPTTITVSDCPCTRTHTFTTQYVTICASESVPVEAPQTTGIQISNGGSKPVLSIFALIAGLLLV